MRRDIARRGEHACFTLVSVSWDPDRRLWCQHSSLTEDFGVNTVVCAPYCRLHLPLKKEQSLCQLPTNCQRRVCNPQCLFRQRLLKLQRVVLGVPTLSCCVSVQVPWKIVLPRWVPMRVWLCVRTGHPFARPVLLSLLPFYTLRVVPSCWLLRKNLLQPQPVGFFFYRNKTNQSDLLCSDNCC